MPWVRMVLEDDVRLSRIFHWSLKQSAAWMMTDVIKLHSRFVERTRT